VSLAEDIGRHNTVDKIAGHLLLRGQMERARQAMLLTTGRISSEMLLKSARLRVPVVVSHTSPTAMAVAFGARLGITVIGYCRGGHFNVYANAWRIQAPRAPQAQEEYEQDSAG
jgi:FdhD protein